MGRNEQIEKHLSECGLQDQVRGPNRISREEKKQAVQEDGKSKGNEVNSESGSAVTGGGHGLCDFKEKIKGGGDDHETDRG